MASGPRSNHFHSTDLWPRIQALAKKSPSALVAVPYFSEGGARLLPLKSGSELVVDCRKATVGAGQVCPADLLKLSRRGVRLYHCEGLHAKVFVFGRRAIVGSANVSNRSRNFLIEAGVETSERALVAECRRFIKGLHREELGPEWLEQLARMYKRPKVAGPAPQSRGRGSKVARPLAWLTGLSEADWSEAEIRAADEALIVARARVRDQSSFTVEQFEWAAHDAKRFRRGDRVFQVTGKRRRDWMISPPARIVDLRRFQTRGGMGVIVSLEVSKRRRPKRFVDVFEKLGRPRFLGGGIVVKGIRDKRFYRDLEALWS